MNVALNYVTERQTNLFFLLPVCQFQVEDQSFIVLKKHQIVMHPLQLLFLAQLCAVATAYRFIIDPFEFEEDDEGPVFPKVYGPLYGIGSILSG